MKKLIGVLVIVVIAVIAVMVFFGEGFGFGSGTGEGNGDSTVAQSSEEQVESSTSQTEEVSGEAANTTVTIEVKQSQYLIEGKETSLSEMEALLTADTAKTTTFILEDNYASAKAWDELKKLFTDYELDVVEQ
ncbi:MAG: hypothetical protein IJF07_00230 [Lachnospiraceae bacterium]|nr:hypothetical protein [Lachnospiraceae bacterium]